MDISNFREPPYKCYNCQELEEGYCTRYECNCCGTCEGELYFFGDELDFSLCSACLILIQAQIQKGLEKNEQYPTLNKIPEQLTILRKSISEDERQKVFDRDNWQCTICGSTEYLQVDHKFPFARGGTTQFDNLQTLCRNCNSKKRDKLH